MLEIMKTVIFLLMMKMVKDKCFQYGDTLQAGTSGTLTIDLFENDFVATALTTSSEVGLAKSIYQAAEIWDVNDIDGVVVGVPARDLSSGYYGWFQTSGPAVLTTGTVVVGKNVMTGETDGAMVVMADDSSAEFLIGGVINVSSQ